MKKIGFSANQLNIFIRVFDKWKKFSFLKFYNIASWGFFVACCFKLYLITRITKNNSFTSRTTVLINSKHQTIVNGKPRLLKESRKNSPSTFPVKRKAKNPTYILNIPLYQYYIYNYIFFYMSLNTVHVIVHNCLCCTSLKSIEFWVHNDI